MKKLSGLSQAEAAHRLVAEGPNELAHESRRTVVRIIFEVMREPMFQLLLASGAIYLALGDLGEALMLLGFAGLAIGLAVSQETRTERTLETLRDLTSPRALVIRDGKESRIAGREVVRGDIMLVAEGDRVAADAVIVECNDLQADESLLTGESVPVTKRAGDGNATPAPPGGEGSPFIYAGTMIVSGRGVAEVQAIGRASEIGKIGAALTRIETEATPLHRETRRLVRIAATGGLGLSLALFLIYGLQGRGWLGGVLSGITLAMSLLPQEFPLILTVFLVLGAWRIAQQRVLTRRSAAIEALGAATVLCTDKTGTLTENRMNVAVLWSDGETLEPAAAAAPLPGRHDRLIEVAILASEPSPFDPMERAIHALADLRRPETEPRWDFVHEYPLTPELPAMTHVWRLANGHHLAAVKGAPEAIADLCRLDHASRLRLRAATAEMAARGLRVLGVASAAATPPWPKDPRNFSFFPLGLIGLRDPVRPAVPEAVRQCRDAGIRVVMVTGDHKETALAIAAQAGIAALNIITGDDIDALSDDALAERLANATICARVRPIQKLRLVEALKRKGEIVAMTGDGVNDAPSLKAAHIGIAMGLRGTDVAREASALVLLDDNFASIVGAVRLGRQIFDNLGKAMSYVLAVHVPIAGAALLPILLGWPVLVMPVHIVFLELIIDPVCSIVFEAEPAERDIMRRPPRDPRRPLFGIEMLLRAILEGIGALAATMGVTALAIGHGADADMARTLAFATLVLTNLGLVFANRSATHSLIATFARPNRSLWWGTGGAVAALLAAIYAPGLHDLFHLTPLAPAVFAMPLAAGLGAVLWAETVKIALRATDRR